MNIDKEIRRVASKHFAGKDVKVFYFGSRVVGNAGERSDIDLGIEGNSPIDARDFFSFSEDLDAIATLNKIDLVDFARVAPEFYNFAKKHIKLIEL